MRMIKGLFRRTPTRPPEGEIAGSSVGRLIQPYIGELPINPQHPARDVYYQSDEREALQIYRQTLRDERCAAALDQRLNAAISTPWEVEPGGTMARDRRAAEAIGEQLRSLEFQRICRQLLHGVWYGWAVGEAIWKPGRTRVELEDLIVRSPDRFWWSPEGELLLRTWTRPLGEPVPAGKFVVLARPSEHGDLPYAPGLARWCFWPVWLKRHGLKFWSVALERFGAPTVRGKYPRNASETEKRALLDMVISLATGGGIIVPDDQDIEALASAQQTRGPGAIRMELPGGRDWRTRVIYETNLRSSYAAGRYRQMKDVAERRPYWRYRHSDVSENPREEHLGWDGLVLRHDDPWWDTHYPANGWGCKCFVETLADRDLRRLGKSGPDSGALRRPARGSRRCSPSECSARKSYLPCANGDTPWTRRRSPSPGGGSRTRSATSRRRGGRRSESLTSSGCRKSSRTRRRYYTTGSSRIPCCWSLTPSTRPRPVGMGRW